MHRTTRACGTQSINTCFFGCVGMRRLHALKADEARLKEGMDCDVALVIKPNNILLWQEMLKSVDYLDLSVVSELRDDTDLVGRAPKTGLWPSKFQPASKSHLTNCMTWRARSGEACVSSLLAVCEGGLEQNDGKSCNMGP